MCCLSRSVLVDIPPPLVFILLNSDLSPCLISYSWLVLFADLICDVFITDEPLSPGFIPLLHPATKKPIALQVMETQLIRRACQHKKYMNYPDHLSWILVICRWTRLKYVTYPMQSTMKAKSPRFLPLLECRRRADPLSGAFALRKELPSENNRCLYLQSFLYLFYLCKLAYLVCLQTNRARLVQSVRVRTPAI